MNIEKNWFIREYEKEIKEGYNIQASYLFDEYKKKVLPFLSLIQEWAAKGISKRRIQLALGISGTVDRALRKYFFEYGEALKNKEVVMDLIAQKDLISAVQLNPTQPKLVEMKLRRYDDEWNNKGNNENILQVPTTINIEVMDKRLTDNELKEKTKSK